MALETYDKENIFAKIIDGAIPSFKVYENRTTLAFLDAFPMAEGHTLVIPKAKGATSFLNMDLGDVYFFRDLQRVANGVKKALGADGVKIISNAGEAAGQTVFHPHFHVIPLFDGKPFTGKSASEMLKAEAATPVQEKIKEALQRPLKQAKFNNVSTIDPNSRGLNLRVKVISAAKTVETQGKTYHEVTVADASAAVVLSLYPNQSDSLSAESTIEVRNGRVVMVEGRIRVVVDKWGKIAPSEEKVESPNTSKNVSDMEYERVKSS